MPHVKTVFTRMIFCVLFVLFALPVQARDYASGDMQVSDVSAFLNARELLVPIDQEYQALGKPSIFRPKALKTAKAGLPAHQTNIDIVREENPDIYQRMNAAVTGYVHEGQSSPFASIEEWAVLADRVMTAFYAQNSDTENFGNVRKQMQEQMPPELMAFAPPETIKMIEDMMASLESVENVSEGDKAVVKQFSKHLALILSEDKDDYVVSE